MPAAARVTDTTNHPGVISGPGSPSVVINGLPAAIQTDTHVCSFPPPAGPHPPAPFATGSTTVLINGIPALRQFDTAVCGAMIMMGSPNVIIG